MIAHFTLDYTHGYSPMEDDLQVIDDIVRSYDGYVTYESHKRHHLTGNIMGCSNPMKVATNIYLNFYLASRLVTT